MMLTSVVRDLHKTYPGQFLTDVRTSCHYLWQNNPYITRLDEKDAELIDCEYPLINQSNQLPYHFIHGFRKHLANKIGAPIQAHGFSGDIHLSHQEKNWLSQVDEITGRPGTRFWIIVAGGKSDYTAKWWDPERCQEIVDHFKDRLLFVQCGSDSHGHTHPRLSGVIDLVGKTDMRQMVRLMYHADGVICPVTMFMHLAAAVETKPGRPRNRPCIVVAGGREPTHWEAYPHHTYLHTLGALPCCDAGGCWKSRVVPLNDGDPKDQSLCEFPVRTPSGRALPRCLDMITARHVIEAVEKYMEYDAIRARQNQRAAELLASGNGGMYSVGVQDHFYHPRNAGTLTDADVVGKSGEPGRGNFMVLYLRIGEDTDKFTEARFQTYGCPSAIACGSWVSEWAANKTFSEAKELTAAEIIKGLGGLPLGREHCAQLAADALQNAVVEARNRRGELHNEAGKV